MKKKLTFVLLMLSTIVFIFSFQKNFSTYTFNVNMVKSNINYLSSDRFKGRMAGTFENELAAAYIRSEFIKNGLKPFDTSYYESFNVTYPEAISGTPYLNVIDKQGQTIKQFIYGTDFKEDMLSFKRNNVTFNKNSDITYTDNFIKITSGNDMYLIYTPINNNLSFRSSYSADSKVSLLIVVSNSTFNFIKDFLVKGNSIDCFIPYTQSETKINNVIGYIPGKNPSLAPIVIGAHFDHMGIDFSNNIYSGALDNASGISFILEMSKYIKSLGTPDRNIIFVGFNAEEYGLLGSTAFANKYLKTLKGSSVLNFDMIGSNNPVPLCLVGSKNDSTKTPLISSLTSLCLKNKIFYNCIFEDSSDHSPFRKFNISAVTFCDNDMTRIHTPNDKVQYISTKSINTCYTVASKEIIGLTFKNNPWVLYNREIWMGALGCSVVFSVTLIAMWKTEKR